MENGAPLDESLHFWIPMTDPELVAVLGKLGEESAELSKIIFRCLIQGIDEKEPATLALNRTELEKEIADVLALIQQAKTRLGLNGEFIHQRAEKKSSTKAIWLDRLREVFKGIPSLPECARRPN